MDPTLDELRRQIDELRDEVRRLSARSGRAVGERARTDESPVRPHRSSRRAVLSAAAAAGVAGVATVVSSRPAAAGLANGEPVELGEINRATESTEISYGANPTPRSHVFAAQDGVWTVQLPNATNTPEVGTRAAVAGWSGNNALHGIYGITSTLTLGASGGRFDGESAQSYGLTVRGRRATLRLARPSGGSQTPPPSRFDAHNDGELTIDDNRDVWLCVESGSPGIWRKLTGPTTAGAFHPIVPARVFDSRSSSPFTPNSSRAVAVAVSLQGVEIVPVGATAVTFNVTVTETQGPNYVSVNPGDAAGFTASTLNWAGGYDVANASVCRLDASRQLRVFCGDQPGSAHVILDVTGYYR
jgi:hypothetical protein